MEEVINLDPQNKEAMLEKLDQLRDEIEKDNILGFAYVALRGDRSWMTAHDFYPAHRAHMIGLLHIKADELTHVYNIEEIARNLGF